MHNKSYVNPTSDLAGIQTLDLQNRNLTLYSAKLRGHFSSAKVNNINGITPMNDAEKRILPLIGTSLKAWNDETNKWQHP